MGGVVRVPYADVARAAEGYQTLGAGKFRPAGMDGQDVVDLQLLGGPARLALWLMPQVPGSPRRPLAGTLAEKPTTNLTAKLTDLV